MDITNIKKVELEITSDCNAACPGCARTQLDKQGLLQVSSFTLDDLKRMFAPEHCAGKEFKFCGVLGDPAIHPQFAEMLEYLLSNGGRTSISTNGAVGTASMWRQIGTLCNTYPKLFHIHFCIDGHEETNHIYRVNTKWAVLERNMNAFCETADEYVYRAKWVFIVFDHNEYELGAAREHADRLGFQFATRTGMRNSYHTWVAEIGKKNDKVKQAITTTGKKEHSKKAQVQKLDKFIAKDKKDENETQEVIQTIQCKFVHEGEIYISARQTMWPCCFLYDWNEKNKENIWEKMEEYGSDWNDLTKRSITEIMQHPWYTKVLEESWHPSHAKHFKRCVRTCAYNKAYHNELIDEKK